MTRCIYTDPRPGDVVQAIPVLAYRLPEPLHVLEVNERGVSWHRPVSGQCQTTSWPIWNGLGSTGCRRTLELLEVAHTEDEGQFDLFGEAV